MGVSAFWFCGKFKLENNFELWTLLFILSQSVGELTGCRHTTPFCDTKFGSTFAGVKIQKVLDWRTWPGTASVVTFF